MQLSQYRNSPLKWDILATGIMGASLLSALLLVGVTIKVSKWDGDGGKRQEERQGFASQPTRACADNNGGATYLKVN